MYALRPLPPRPSIEFERKEAKELLRQLRAGDAASINRARARHPKINSHDVERIKLSDAQLVIAREYGFLSWPWMVRYFGDVARQSTRTSNTFHAPTAYDEILRAFLLGHANKRRSTGRSLAAYVPRFYGLRVEEVFEVPITEDDAKLAIARGSCCTTWEMLLERATAEHAPRRMEWEPNRLRMAANAMELGDLPSLQQLVSEHPEMLHPPESLISRGASLMRMALQYEQTLGQRALQPFIAWLELQGNNVQRELDTMLCGHMNMKASEVVQLLDRGANPDWVAPNGISVLEHAIIRYWNGDAVDVLAARARPRKALWIAAGMGDVNGVGEFLDRQGRPTAQARDNRPDFSAVGPMGMPCVPAANDEEVLMEAFQVALLNGRTHVIEYMISRGFPVNTLLWDSTIATVAAGNGWTRVLESLIRCGADVNLRGAQNGSAKEMALYMLQNQPPSENRRRIAELCGIDV